MYGRTYSKSMDQPGKVANPARGQLKRENEYSPVPVRALEFGLAGRVQPSRSASSSPFAAVIKHALPSNTPESLIRCPPPPILLIL